MLRSSSFGIFHADGFAHLWRAAGGLLGLCPCLLCLGLSRERSSCSLLVLPWPAAWPFLNNHHRQVGREEWLHALVLGGSSPHYTPPNLCWDLIQLTGSPGFTLRKSPHCPLLSEWPLGQQKHLKKFKSFLEIFFQLIGSDKTLRKRPEFSYLVMVLSIVRVRGKFVKVYF